MSTFSVDKKRIAKVWAHSNADRLDLCSVEGMSYQFVCQKGTQVEGNLVAYFPVDSLLPPDLIEHFGIGSMLAGKDKNRIKTVKLRGEASQGFCSNTLSVCEFLNKKGLEYTPETLPDDLTELLQITKYEPPEIVCKNAKLIKLPFAAYDIEGVSRYPKVIEYLMDQDVVITEKVEGSNFFLELLIDGTVKIAQRNFYIESNDPNQPHSFEVIGKRDILPLAQKLQSEKFTNCDIRIRGEFLGDGVQNNIYKIKGHKILVFEIDINHKPLDAIDLLNLVKEYNIDFVPILFSGKLKDFLNGKTVDEAATGKSALFDTLKEGIVIRGHKNEHIPEHIEKNYGKNIIKHRSISYLSKSEL